MRKVPNFHSSGKLGRGDVCIVVWVMLGWKDTGLPWPGGYGAYGGLAGGDGA